MAKSELEANGLSTASGSVPLESETSNAAPQLSNLSISIPPNAELSSEEPGPRVKVAKRMHSDLTSTDGALTAEQLELLKKDSPLLDLLQDGALRSQIVEILSSSDSEASLTRMLDSNPNFSAFVQSMLHQMGLRDADGVSTL